MVVKNWIIMGIAVAAILAYTVGIPPSFSAEYSKSTQYTRSENNCGNTEASDSGSGQPPSDQPPSDYESLIDNTDSTDYTATYCSNTNSQIQGDENTASLSSVHR
jgi:hypothetical protein